MSAALGPIEALRLIAEENDAGRHDGIPEPCPAHDADTMFAVARAALEKLDGMPAHRAMGEQQMAHFIVRMRDDDVFLIGPFETQAAAGDYGVTKLAPGGIDDPRWQTIELPVLAGSDSFTLNVLKPDATEIE